MTKLAQIQLAPEGGFRGIGPLGLEGGAESAPGVFNRIISSAIGIMTVIAFVWFVFLFLSGAYGVMNAGGDKQALEMARKRLVMGVTGVVVIVAAVFVIDLIGTLLGIPNILNPGQLFEDIAI